MWFFASNLPGMGGPTNTFAAASTVWLIIETHKPCHQLSNLATPKQRITFI
jgi:hypothetical protein